MSEIHPLVMATIENERGRRELELERLRSARAACVTATTGGQNRALSLGKKIRELEKIAGSWRLVLATMLGEMDEMAQAAESATDAFRELSVVLGETKVPPMLGVPVGEEPRVVGSKSSLHGKIRCVPCTEKHRSQWTSPATTLIDVTSEDLPDGGVCVSCHADVLA